MVTGVFEAFLATLPAYYEAEFKVQTLETN
jgi:hypothetical protein